MDFNMKFSITVKMKSLNIDAPTFQSKILFKKEFVNNKEFVTALKLIEYACHWPERMSS
jgi:hypothetical protein